MDVEAEDEFTKMIQSMPDYIIQHNTTQHKKNLMELSTEFKEATKDYIDILLKLEGLISSFLTDEFLEGKAIFLMIDDLSKKLQVQLITKSRQSRL